MTTVKVWYPYAAIDHYAPGLIEEIDIPIKDDIFDILLLGGSVLTNQWGDIPNALDKLLSDSLISPFKVHNLANPARTSRDSWQNYQQLEGHPYDLVIIYHGIN